MSSMYVQVPLFASASDLIGAPLSRLGNMGLGQVDHNAVSLFGSYIMSCFCPVGADDLAPLLLDITSILLSLLWTPGELG